jgi:hypothetical protein
MATGASTLNNSYRMGFTGDEPMNAQSTQTMRRTLVEPGVPKGTPAVTTRR